MPLELLLSSVKRKRKNATFRHHMQNMGVQDVSAGTKELESYAVHCGGNLATSRWKYSKR